MLRAYQQEAIDALYGYFGANDGNPLVVVPTAGGKSWILAGFIKSIFDQWHNQRVLILSHVKEILEQDHEKLMRSWPQAPAGIYSAGLKRRDTLSPILFAGIQSVHKRWHELGRFDIVIIDEAHRVPAKGHTMYRALISNLMKFNADLKVIGLTATPYRTGHGMLTEGDDRIFTDIAYNTDIKRLIDEGWLSRLTTKQTQTQIDTSDVHVRSGEFVQEELDAAVASVLKECLREVIRMGESRRSWLLFCAGVKNSQAAAEFMNQSGIPAGCIIGDTPSAERAEMIRAYRAGDLRALSSVNTLTTGFDAPQTDMIAFLRPTMSPVLFCQMSGRGMRIAEGKSECLVLDFAGNVKRHGPIDQVNIRKKGDAPPPTKVCPECESIVPISMLTCPDCGYAWPEPERAPAENKLTTVASAAPILSWEVELERHEVARVEYREHRKEGKPPSLRVDYYDWAQRIASEWICLEHTGWARQKAAKWWEKRSGSTVPETINEALEMIDRDGLREPSVITTRMNGKYDEIVDYLFVERVTRQRGQDDESNSDGEDAYGQYIGAGIRDCEIPF